MAKVTPRLITLTVATVDRSDEIAKAEIHAAEAPSDFVTFEAARTGGGRDYALHMTIAEDHATATIMTLILTSPGTEVAGVYAPYGNAVASATEPHFTFTAIVSEPDGLLMGAEATSSASAKSKLDVVWPLKGKPVRKTTA